MLDAGLFITFREERKAVLLGIKVPMEEYEKEVTILLQRKDFLMRHQ